MEADGDGDPADAVLARQGLATPAGRRGAAAATLAQVEEAVLSWAVGELSRRRSVFTIRDLNVELDDPGPELLRMARLSPLEMAKVLSDVRFALQKLCDRTLRGMFDGPTNVNVDWRHGPGVVVDLSAVHNDPEVLPLVMLAATYWLGEAMRHPGRQKLQVIDEAWAAVRHGAAYVQSLLEAVPPVRGGQHAGRATGPRTCRPRTTTAPPRRRSPPGCSPTSRPGSCCASRPRRSRRWPSCSPVRPASSRCCRCCRPAGRSGRSAPLRRRADRPQPDRGTALLHRLGDGGVSHGFTRTEVRSRGNPRVLSRWCPVVVPWVPEPAGRSTPARGGVVEGVVGVDAGGVDAEMLNSSQIRRMSPPVACDFVEDAVFAERLGGETDLDPGERSADGREAWVRCGG